MKHLLLIISFSLFANLTVFAQEVIFSEDFSQNPSAVFQPYFTTQSLAIITNNNGILTGGSSPVWTGTGNNTTAQNAWIDNALHISSFSGYVDANNYNASELQVTLKQTADVSLKHSWFRVLINGVQQSDNCGKTNFNPITFDNDIYRTITFDLSSYSGQQFILTLQASCKANNLDATYIDDVRVLYNNTQIAKTLPYSQNFDSIAFPSSWISCANDFSFGWETGEFSNLGIPAHGNYISSINYAADQARAVNNLISPYFNFESLDTINLVFDVFADHNFSVLLSNNNQAFSDTLLSQSATNSWQTISLDLSQYGGLSSAQIVISNSDNNDNLSLLAIDNFNLSGSGQASHDISISALISPEPSPQFSISENVGVRIKNYSQTSISNFIVAYKINNGLIYSDSISSIISAGDSLDYFFSETIDMSNPDNYLFTTWVNKAYDINQTNDTLEILIVSAFPTITNYPYLQSFEQSNYWQSGGTNSSWELGVPTGVFINSASHGQNAWVTNLSGSYNSYEQAWVLSPVFDFSNLSSPKLSFNYIIDCEDFEDGACLQFSTNQGATWSTLGAVGDNQYWYNSTWVTGLASFGTYQGWSLNPYQSWVEAEYDIAFLAGQSEVRFRYIFGSTENNSFLEGFAFDNFRIFDIQGNDLAISDLLFPANDCVMTNSELVTIEIANMGISNVSGFEVSYMLNNNIAITEFITDTVYTDSTLIYTFSTACDLSLSGIKSFFIDVDYLNDQAAFNDTLTVILDFQVSRDLPFVENFESVNIPYGWQLSQEPGSDGWLIGNDLGSSYFPVPAHGNYAASNDDTCYCDMSSDMIITPACNFSTYQYINLEFDAFFTGELNSSASVLVSSDCGYTWDLVSFVPGNATSWQTINVDLSSYSGFSSIKIAFKHSDNGGWAAGFAIDNVNITGTVFSQTQEIVLRFGWGIMSSYIDPTAPSIDSVFSDVVNKVVIVKNGMGLVFWPFFNLNSIGDHVIGDGYQYKMSQADTLLVTGVPVFPQNVTLNFNSGWSIIAYLRNTPAPLTQLLSTISSEILLIKNDDGQVYWPYFQLDAIGDMIPGKGYQINLTNNVSYSYPAND